MGFPLRYYVLFTIGAEIFPLLWIGIPILEILGRATRGKHLLQCLLRNGEHLHAFVWRHIDLLTTDSQRLTRTLQTSRQGHVRTKDRRVVPLFLRDDNT